MRERRDVDGRIVSIRDKILASKSTSAGICLGDEVWLSNMLTRHLLEGLTACC